MPLHHPKTQVRGNFAESVFIRVYPWLNSSPLHPHGAAQPSNIRNGIFSKLLTAPSNGILISSVRNEENCKYAATFAAQTLLYTSFCQSHFGSGAGERFFSISPGCTNLLAPASHTR